MEIINPHDKFFKETFSIRENVIDFLCGTFPPELLKKLELKMRSTGGFVVSFAERLQTTRLEVLKLLWNLMIW